MGNNVSNFGNHSNKAANLITTNHVAKLGEFTTIRFQAVHPYFFPNWTRLDKLTLQSVLTRIRAALTFFQLKYIKLQPLSYFFLCVNRIN